MDRILLAAAWIATAWIATAVHFPLQVGVLTIVGAVLIGSATWRSMLMPIALSASQAQPRSMQPAAAVPGSLVEARLQRLVKPSEPALESGGATTSR